jgi:hypothetical protein
MATGLTTTTNLPAQVQQSYDYKILSTPYPNNIHKIPAERKYMPARGGRTLRMSRYAQLPPAIVPLGNSGQTPPPTIPERFDIDATISFYGSWIGVNEQVN